MDRFDELIGPRKARLLRAELRRLFPRRGLIPPGCVYACAEPEYVGRMPVRMDIEVLAAGQQGPDIRPWFRRPLGPLGLPADAFVEIEPIEENGQRLRRFKVKALGDAILTEVRSELIEIGEVEVKPMTVPSALAFYASAKKRAEEDEAVFKTLDEIAKPKDDR